MNKKYKRRKVYFSLLVIICVLAFLGNLFYPILNVSKSESYIDVGICGAINRPAVYRLQTESSLANLIVRGNGLKLDANVDSIDFNERLLDKRIYHIPYRSNKFDVYRDSIKITKVSSKKVVNEDKEINILYVGYPALYYILTYNKAKRKAVFTFIPYSTVFLNNEFRIIDIFFTLGIGSTVDILMKSLNKKIDYYYIQDKASFVRMIENFGGIEIDVDKDFAAEYRLKEGRQMLNGELCYNYISFIKSTHNNVLDIHRYQELFNNKRRERQSEIIAGMYKMINTSIKDKKIEFYAKILNKNDCKSNLDITVFSKLLNSVLYKNSLSFELIPGEYKFIDRKLYYIPANYGFDLLNKKQRYKVFNLHGNDNNQIIY